MSVKKSTTPKAKKTEESAIPAPKVNILSTIRLDIKHKNETQKKLTQAIKTNDVTICIGPAGTGKSIMSIFMGLKLLKEEPEKYNNIKMVKSITQLRDETLPALPGDAMDKMFFQNMSFFDSLHQLIGEKNTGQLINDNKIKFDVIGSFRGRNLNSTIVILDETQNISHDNLKTILTRLGENSKLIILGDPEQIDIKNKNESSLATLVRRVKIKPMEGVEIVEFSEDDIVRHRLTSYFINLFKENEPIIVINKIEKKKKMGVINKIKLFIKSRFKM
jgi:phosphate starvation-inducible PhoH-like protein